MTPKWYSTVYFHPKYTVPYITSLFITSVENDEYLAWMKENGYRVVKSCETEELVQKLSGL